MTLCQHATVAPGEATAASLVAQLGPEGEPLRAWARDIGANGGDPPDKAADLVLSLVSDSAASITGRFLWIRDGLQKPIPTNWNGDEDQT